MWIVVDGTCSNDIGWFTVSKKIVWNELCEFGVIEIVGFRIWLTADGQRLMLILENE